MGSERDPLLSNRPERSVEFTAGDRSDPYQWSQRSKYFQVALIFCFALVLPMTSSIQAPASQEMMHDFGVNKQTIIAGQTVFVCMLGLGPLFLAPMSETFGRRPVYLTCLLFFALCQIPTALAKNAAMFIAFRLFGGFFASVAVGNGGGSIQDLFEKEERAPVLGIYLSAPLLGPTIGPLIAGQLLQKYRWPAIFWLVLILAGTITVVCYFGLKETRAVTILQKRQKELQRSDRKIKWVVEGAPSGSFFAKLAKSSTKAVKILFGQPIVLILSIYQALIFSSMYSLYAEYTTIWQEAPYRFSIRQISWTYAGPASGFILSAVVMIACIDRVYKRLAKAHSNDGEPEYRLPLANIGAVLLPLSLFAFGWAVEKRLAWPYPIVATVFFGASQVSIFNCVQTFYIDAFEGSAASALAAGALLRSLVGGVTPLFADALFTKLGYGWGMSIFGFCAVALLPAPTMFYYYGAKLRKMGSDP